MKRIQYLLYVVAALTVGFDQLLKWIVRRTLPIGDAVLVIPGVVELTHLQNPGAAFSLFPNQTWLFVLIAAIVVVAVIFVHQRWHLDRLAQVGLGLLLGGALGNMVDRIISPTHTVTDYVYFYTIHFPVFNLADASIDFGVLFLLISSFRSGTERSDDGKGDPK
ncbi:lipoprotein signal peptidase [Alicyclobacillus hesperidum subsp. aegles]|uniref:signal peptidase II n=1 Tax=Alicyclobacillus hesperidum TaxID=89784 RepID=UPI00222BD899|nr:signal peptidase II [Alicyclobacillus hesperidum]GLG01089.1 lipoprotein signal peptidase [Alicyclobacillus hesperidum subsp. aegles]